MNRTELQNKALHVFCRELAKVLNGSGYDMKVTLEALGAVDIPWTQNTVKEKLWKPVQHALTLKESSTQISRTEVSEIYDTLHRALVNADIPVYVPWPTEETKNERQRVSTD